MKKKFVIVNAILVMAVLFSMLFQSVHSFEHVAQQLSEKKCHHQYHSREEITHQHHHFDHCFVCDVVFSSFFSSETFTFQFQYGSVAVPYFFSFPEAATCFSGSSYTLRGPPQFVV